MSWHGCVWIPPSRTWHAFVTLFLHPENKLVWRYLCHSWHHPRLRLANERVARHFPAEVMKRTLLYSFMKFLSLGEEKWVLSRETKERMKSHPAFEFQELADRCRCWLRLLGHICGVVWLRSIGDCEFAVRAWAANMIHSFFMCPFRGLERNIVFAQFARLMWVFDAGGE